MTLYSPKDHQEFQRFVSKLNHDTRNSIRALREVPNWIREDLMLEGTQIGQDVESHLNLLSTQAQRLDTMMGDLVTYFRVGLPGDRGRTDLNDTLDKVLRAQNPSAGFEVSRDIKVRFPDITEQDQTVLLSCLLSNAFKHHGEPEGTIHIRSVLQQGDCVISVRDTGPGISERCADEIFEPLKTLQPRDDVEGSGMGLAIVRKIAAHYGGSAILANPGDMTGACFEIRIRQE